MWKFIKSTETNTTFQILLGDFNAEPDTDAIKYLQGKYSKRRSEHREWSTVVDISIPPPSFKPVLLS